ncbi:DEAD/DEAH box helicase [Arthrobacter sp. NPDC055138]
MAAHTFPLVDVSEIIRLVGGAAFARGKIYSSDGSVAELDWDPSVRLLTAKVIGTAALPYRCRIYLETGTSGQWRPASASCSCPVGSDCKHVAAVLLNSNGKHLITNQAFAREPEPEPAGWEDSLAGLIGGTPDGAKGGAGKPAKAKAKSTSGLGLQFDLLEPGRRNDRQYRPSGLSLPQASAAGPSWTRKAGNRLRVGVRPVLQNETGRWVRSKLRWNTISYKTYGLPLDAEQHRWFSQFAPLHRATGLTYFGEDNDWLFLDEFSSPLLWELFAEAKRLGIALIGAKADTVVEIRDQAVIGLDAHLDGVAPAATATGGPAEASDGDAGDRPVSADLVLTPSLRIDGQELPTDTAGIVGTHGVYHYAFAGQTVITLAPTAHPVTDQEANLLLSGAPLTVPAADVEQFMERYYPALSQRIAVASSDDSVNFPEIVPPALVLTASYRKGNVLQVGWHIEYRHGDKPLRLPVDGEPETSHYRDLPAEQDLLVAAAAVPGVGTTAARTLRDMATVDFTRYALPALEQLDGVRVDIVGEKPDYQELTEAPELTISTVETEESDWFDLGVMVRVAGRTVPFGNIFKSLARGQTRLLLVDKSYLSLEQPVFDRLRQLVDEARQMQDRESGELQISRYQASLWEDLEEVATETVQARTWRDSVQGLLALESVEQTPLPAGLDAELRPYQAEGFNWLAFLWRHRLGGVLADDMGLGKTLQALALLLHAKQHGEPALARPFLVVAPTSVVSNWVHESRRFAPDLKIEGITDTQVRGRRPLSEITAEADVVVTSYTLFRLDFETYQETDWAGLILDEAQFVKNRATKVHQCARDLRAPFKMAITGTPMENNLMELWSIFSIVAPGLFPSAVRFVDQYQRPIERNQDSELLQKLRRRIKPLMMRRSKEAVARDLPEKQEQVLEVELTPKHRRIYDTHLQRERQKVLRLVEDMDKNRFTIFQSLTLLRMLSLDPSLVDAKYSSVPSSKLGVLFEQLEDVIGEGHRALIFSQFTSYLKKAAQQLDAAGVEYCYLDGSTRRRAEVIEKFKNGSAPVFLISLKAGGFGLNLTEADYCFLLDPWWNPATEAQAVDRTHRIGQTKNVMVYRMVARGTIEEKVMALKERKAKLISSVLEDDAMFSSKLTATDIRGLFGD